MKSSLRNLSILLRAGRLCNRASGGEATECRLRLSPRKLLLLLIPAALVAPVAMWFFSAAPIDAAVTVDGFSRFETVDGCGSPTSALGSQVRIFNRSRRTVWYLENTRYYMFQLVDGKWTSTSSGTSLPGAPEKQLWSAQEGMQSVSILVPIYEDATAIKVGIAFTSDPSNPKAHWVFSPTVKVRREGQDRFPEVLARSADDALIESQFDK
ncbi:MAG: hypothetical protein ACLQNE_15485 [Thermoguttaceae bacterium]